MGDFAGAQSVCNSVPLLTQRLRLLAVLVDAASTTPGISTKPVLDEIKELLTQVDLGSLQKDEAIDVATDLYPVDPETALIVLRGAIKDDPDSDSMEIAMARIALSALQSQHGVDRSEPSDKAIPKTTEILVDERLRRFIEATRLSLSTRTVQEVLSKTDSIEEPAERLFILRKWILQHSDVQDILLVVESAIQESISSTSFSPTATFYREVLTPLPQIADADARSRLIAIVDAQKPVIQKRGPTVDYVRLEILLAQCNYLDGQLTVAAHRLEDLYLEILHSIDTLETRTSSFSWCLSEINRFDGTRVLDQHTQFRELVEDEFSQAVSEVLNASADQFSILEGALEPLALYLPSRAVDIAKALNTDNRRNEAFNHIVEVRCESTGVPPDYELLFDILDVMDSGRLFDAAVTTTADRLTDDVKVGLAAEEHIVGVLRRLDRCASASERAECLGNIAGALGEESEQEQLYSSIATRLIRDFQNIAIPRARYNVGCKLVVILKESCPILASNIFSLFSNNNEVSRIGENVDKGCVFVLDLIIKATAALAQAGLLLDEDVVRVRKIISQVGDPTLQLRLFSKLAFFFWREQKQGYFATVVNEDIWPTLEALPSTDESGVYMAWGEVYAVIWLDNRDRARAAITGFPRRQRNHCIWTLCFALLHKQPIGEPL